MTNPMWWSEEEIASLTKPLLNLQAIAICSYLDPIALETQSAVEINF